MERVGPVRREGDRVCAHGSVVRVEGEPTPCARRHAVHLAEPAADERRVDESPAACNLCDRLVSARRPGEVVADTLEAGREDPLFETDVGVGAEPEELSYGDVVGIGDQPRRQFRIAQVTPHIATNPGEQDVIHCCTAVIES